jgi:hypothetical protein
VRILNLGAGVQSTTLFLMLIDGDLPPVDYAIFADTGDEPQDVYQHLEFLRTLGGPEIVVCRASETSLGDNLKNGMNATGQWFVSIPAYTADDVGKPLGIGRRQCTAEYKIKPIEKAIRQLAGLEKGQRKPKELEITQLFGLSFDEPRRVDRVRTRFIGRAGWRAEFPLFDEFMTRSDCLAWLSKRLPGYTVPRSACVFCPYRSDDEWLRLKETDRQGWNRAVEIDEAMRDESSRCTKGMESKQYVHRSCQPLALVQLQASPPDKQMKFQFSQMDCEGMCGN